MTFRRQPIAQTVSSRVLSDPSRFSQYPEVARQTLLQAAQKSSLLLNDPSTNPLPRENEHDSMEASLVAGVCQQLMREVLLENISKARKYVFRKIEALYLRRVSEYVSDKKIPTPITIKVKDDGSILIQLLYTGQQTEGGSEDKTKIILLDDYYDRLSSTDSFQELVLSIKEQTTSPGLTRSREGFLRSASLRIWKETMHKNLTAEFNAEFTSLLSAAYSTWLKEPCFGTQAAQENLLGNLEKYMESLVVRRDIRPFMRDTEVEAFRGCFESEAMKYHLDYAIEEEVFSFTTPKRSRGIRGAYDPELASLVISHKSSPGREAILSLYLHGASTLTSHSVSLIEDIKRAQASFSIKGYALDLPGSMGNMGISFKEAEDPMQIAAILNRWFEKMAAVHPDLPAIAFGRSLGSTIALASAFYLYMARRESDIDLVVLTSLSLPHTIRAQIEFVRQLDGFYEAPGSLDMVVKFCNCFLKDFTDAHAIYPERMKDFGENILLLQGHADADGGPDVVRDLREFSRLIPEAQVFEFEDPLADRPEIAEIIGVDRRLASHFLASPRHNATQKEFPAVPGEYLPTFFDQTMQVYSTCYAMLDYLIGCSKVSDKKREALSHKRFLKTGSYDEKAYFKWYIQSLAGEYPGLSYEKVISHETIPSDDCIEGRLKRVYTSMYRYDGTVEA